MYSHSLFCSAVLGSVLLPGVVERSFCCRTLLAWPRLAERSWFGQALQNALALPSLAECASGSRDLTYVALPCALLCILAEALSAMTAISPTLLGP
jgi:hypothetical protein